MAAPKALPFLETFQFVESSKARDKSFVPNHLLESKIYAKIQQNAAIKVTPAIVHFEGFQIGQPKQVILSLCNVAREVIRVHIVPPQTNVFGIKYTKAERLAPGMTMNCIVEFTATEYRYYYDAIRLHCPGEDNIIIPIHAYPVMDASEFPPQLKFPMTSLGHHRSHTITLRCHVPIEFEYQLKKLQDDEAFEVAPLNGIVPRNGTTEIYITYRPISYCTSTLRLQLETSQFNSEPLICTITGYCQPGAQVKELTVDSAKLVKSVRVASPLERSRQRKQVSRKAIRESQNVQNTKRVVEGVRLPERLDTVHHVNNVLIQTPGKLSLKELIEAEKSVSGRQMKENRFEQAVRKNVYEERQNQLRWQVKLGDCPMPAQDKERVVAERQHAWAVYKELRGDPTEDDELQRFETESSWKRTRRDISQLAEEGIQFDLYSNNPWSTRHIATDRFIQAARKIILRNRAKKNLSQLNAFLKSWNKKQELSALDDGITSGKHGVKRVPVIDPDEDGQGSGGKKLALVLKSSKVTHAKYPFFVAPNKKDELAPDALNEVVTYETRVDMEQKTPYFNLQVPQQSQLLGYNDHEIHLGYDYVEPVLPRALRSGAEEEIINLVKPHEAAATNMEVVQKQEGKTPNKKTKKAAELRVEDVEKHELESQETSLLSLSPPEAMFKPIEYPPLHIFNPTPGLQVFESPVPYAEVDTDYHLCPLPRYIVHANDQSNHKQTQKMFLSRQDVIKGTMSWKKFPSQGLTSLANTPTLTNVWVPRWKDPFSRDMLPHEVPELQSGLDENDILEYGDDDETEPEVHLTPEMVAAQFDMLDTDRTTAEEKKNAIESFPYDNKIPSTNLPVSSNGPVPREKREQELDYFLSRRSNRLGQKFDNKIDQLSSLATRDDLNIK